MGQEGGARQDTGDLMQVANCNGLAGAPGVPCCWGGVQHSHNIVRENLRSHHLLQQLQ